MVRKASPAATSDWVIRSAQPGSVERIEAWFGSHGYDPHRHDTYSIGRTLAGVQSFHYKGRCATACRVIRSSCTLTKSMMVWPVRMQAFATGWLISTRR